MLELETGGFSNHKTRWPVSAKNLFQMHRQSFNRAITWKILGDDVKEGGLGLVTIAQWGKLGGHIDIVVLSIILSNICSPEPLLVFINQL